jgi:hypothetical protein
VVLKLRLPTKIFFTVAFFLFANRGDLPPNRKRFNRGSQMRGKYSKSMETWRKRLQDGIISRLGASGARQEAVLAKPATS